MKPNRKTETIDLDGKHRCVLILLDYKSSFRQELEYYQSLNINSLIESIERHFEVAISSVEDLLNSKNIYSLHSYFVLCTSSQNQEYKSLIIDTLEILEKKNTLLPRSHFFKAHENKGVQSIAARNLDISFAPSIYLSSYESLLEISKEISFPIVFKGASGAGSKNVFLARNESELLSIALKYTGNNLLSVKRFIQKLLIGTKYTAEIATESTNLKRFVLQKFIPGCSHDWKVLIFGKRYFALKRSVKKGDFKASGSGLNEFAKPSKRLLEFSELVFNKLDTPFVSLDIAIPNNSDPVLLEYQGTHFGPLTAQKSKFCHTKDKEEWIELETNINIEENYAQAIVWYIKKSKKRGAT